MDGAGVELAQLGSEARTALSSPPVCEEGPSSSRLGPFPWTSLGLRVLALSLSFLTLAIPDTLLVLWGLSCISTRLLNLQYVEKNIPLFCC